MHNSSSLIIFKKHPIKKFCVSCILKQKILRNSGSVACMWRQYILFWFSTIKKKCPTLTHQTFKRNWNSNRVIWNMADLNSFGLENQITRFFGLVSPVKVSTSHGTARELFSLLVLHLCISRFHQPQEEQLHVSVCAQIFWWKCVARQSRVANKNENLKQSRETREKLFAHSGPAVLGGCHTTQEFQIQPLFGTIALEKVRLQLRLGWTDAGRLRSRTAATEETGKLRDVNLIVEGVDKKLIEVLACGLPLQHEAQPAEDITLRIALISGGIACPNAATNNGAMLQRARQDGQVAHVTSLSSLWERTGTKIILSGEVPFVNVSISFVREHNTTKGDALQQNLMCNKRSSHDVPSNAFFPSKNILRSKAVTTHSIRRWNPRERTMVEWIGSPVLSEGVFPNDSQSLLDGQWRICLFSSWSCGLFAVVATATFEFLCCKFGKFLPDFLGSGSYSFFIQKNRSAQCICRAIFWNK